VSYIALLGRRWLPAQPPIQRLLSEPEGGLADVYRLGERLFRVRLLPDSPLAGVALEASGLRELYNLNVVAIEHNRKWNYAVQSGTVFNPGDVLLVEGRQDELNRKFTGGLFEVLPSVKWRVEDLDDSDTALVEMVLASRSRLIGQTLREVHFREKYQMSVLGIWRSGRPIRTGFQTFNCSLVMRCFCKVRASKSRFCRPTRRLSFSPAYPRRSSGIAAKPFRR